MGGRIASVGAQNKVPTNTMATTNASQGRWKIDIGEAFCSSPPAPTPVIWTKSMFSEGRQINQLCGNITQKVIMRVFQNVRYTSSQEVNKIGIEML